MTKAGDVLVLLDEVVDELVGRFLDAAVAVVGCVVVSALKRILVHRRSPTARKEQGVVASCIRISDGKVRVNRSAIRTFAGPIVGIARHLSASGDFDDASRSFEFLSRF